MPEQVAIATAWKNKKPSAVPLWTQPERTATIPGFAPTSATFEGASGSARAESAALTPSMTWDGPCEEMFEYLARNDSEALFRAIESGGLAAPFLTFAAEWAGRTSDPERARPVLLSLLAHESPLVREGAIYGLQLLGNDGLTRDALLRHISPTSEPSPGVRAAAREALSLIDE